MPLTTYYCPKCRASQTCLGSVDGHFCPSNKSKWVGPWLTEEELEAYDKKEAKKNAKV